MKQGTLPKRQATSSLPKRPAGMADRVRHFDWASTSLGPIAIWSPSLQTAVGICVNSHFPTVIWWGPNLINIYNDAHVRVLAHRHPAALGKPAAEVWPEVWSALEAEVEGVVHRGEAVFRERIPFELSTEGKPVKRFFTYSMSPIPDGNGGIGGLFHVSMDETNHVLFERKQERAEKRLRTTKAAIDQDLARWQAVIAEMAEGVILADAEGNLLDWNRAALDMHGYARIEDARKNVSEMESAFDVRDVNGEPVPFEQRPMNRLLRGEPFRNWELRVGRKGHHQLMPITYSGTLIRNAAGAVVLALLTLHGMTSDPENAPATFKPAPLDAVVPENETPDQRQQRQAAEAADGIEDLLRSMDLSIMERRFAKAVGEHLADAAIDAYVAAAQEQKQYAGTCIAAAIAVALMIVRDEE